LLCPANPLTAIPLAKRPERADQLLQPPPPWLSRPLRCCCCPLAMLQLQQQSLARSSAPGRSLCSEACVSDPELPRRPRPLYSITTHALSHTHTHVVAHTHLVTHTACGTTAPPRAHCKPMEAKLLTGNTSFPASC
jgi:hypothetical protein